MRAFARAGLRSVVLRGAAVALAGAVLHCAHMEPPSGGPVDTVPPAVVAVYPPPGARNVPLDAPVVVQFSEWIDRNVARSQAFISPPARGKLRVVAEGDKLQLRPSEAAGGWRPRTTYQVTVLPTLQDLHGVKAGRAFTLRFSTGPEMDSASVTGAAMSAAPKGTLIAALYHAANRASASSQVGPLSARDPDFKPAALPEPWRELPAFLALADSTGAFRFDSVAAGTYALFVFEDVNGNFAFDYGFESAAPGPLDVSLRPRAEALGLRAVPLDTLPLRIASTAFIADARDTAASVPGARVPGKVRIEFTRAPHPLRAAEASRYRLLPDSGAAVPVTSAAWSPLDAAWMLDAGPLAPGRSYRVETRGRPDFPGRDDGIDTSLSFSVEAAPDTTEWKFAFVEASATTLLGRAIAKAPDGREFAVASNRPLSPARWKLLNDRLVARVDTAPAPRTLSLVNNFTFSVKFSGPATRGKGLELRLAPGPGDSTFRSLAALEIADSAGWGGIRFTPPARYAGWNFRLETPDNTAYRVPAEALPAGLYRLSAFRDDDRDGVWNPGSLKPWIPQEPQARLLDSVQVVPGVTTDLTRRLEPAGSRSTGP